MELTLFGIFFDAGAELIISCMLSDKLFPLLVSELYPALRIYEMSYSDSTCAPAFHPHLFVIAHLFCCKLTTAHAVLVLSCIKYAVPSRPFSNRIKFKLCDPDMYAMQNQYVITCKIESN